MAIVQDTAKFINDLNERFKSGNIPTQILNKKTNKFEDTRVKQQNNFVGVLNIKNKDLVLVCFRIHLLKNKLLLKKVKDFSDLTSIKVKIDLQHPVYLENLKRICVKTNKALIE